MATLGEAGLLEQPHTSAGRVPTAAAFRYYVEQITQPGRMAAGAQPVRPGRSAARRILIGAVVSERSTPRADRGELLGVTSTNDYLERTSHVLALLPAASASRSPAPQPARYWNTSTFHGFPPDVCFAVLVTQAGAVQDRVLALDAN